MTDSGATGNEYAWLADMIGPPRVTPATVAWDEIEKFMGVPLPAGGHPPRRPVPAG